MSKFNLAHIQVDKLCMKNVHLPIVVNGDPSYYDPDLALLTENASFDEIPMRTMPDFLYTLWVPWYDLHIMKVDDERN